MNGKLTRWAAVLVLAGWSQVSIGAVIYDYVGNDFTEFPLEGSLTPPASYQPGDRVTAWIEFPDLLAPNLVGHVAVDATAFSFMDGVQSIDNTTATDSSFLFSTDVNGLPIAWVTTAILSTVVVGGGEYRSIGSFNYPDNPFDIPGNDHGGTLKCGPESSQGGCSLGEPYYSSAGTNSESPGAWTLRQPSPVPIPAATWLLGSALLGLGAAKKRRKV